MKTDKSSISQAQSYRAIGEFWDAHDVTDYWDATEPVEFEVDIQSDMKYPPHPSGVVKDCLEELDLSVTDAARILNVPRSTLSRLLNGHSAISPEMALRLSAAFGSSPEMWLRMQAAYDLAQARDRADLLNVHRYKPAHPSVEQPVLT